MTTTLPIQAGGFAQRAASALHPALLWPMATALALWPHGAWMLRRWRDGSDDPLGLIALLALALLWWRARPTWLAVPHRRWMLASLLGVVAANAASVMVTPLLASVVGAAALACALLAWLPAEAPSEIPAKTAPETQGGLPRAAVAGLCLLSLPLIASLQYYLGYPLRVMTAELSAWLLNLSGGAATRLGTTLSVNGQLVIVDAPCSGVQLAWLGYFSACVSAAVLAMDQRRLLRALPIVSAIVIGGNVLRNTVLVALESRPEGLTSASHEAIGLAAVALVTAAIAVAMKAIVVTAKTDSNTDNDTETGNDQATSAPSHAEASRATPSIIGLRRGAAWMLVVGALVPLVSASTSRTSAGESTGASQSQRTEVPREWQGRPLRPLAMMAIEQRFAARFPGSIGRFADGERTLILREVNEPTRMLHPAADCFRGLGYAIHQSRIERRTSASIAHADRVEGELVNWRCFAAERPAEGGSGEGSRLRVCERIVGSEGDAYTDSSAWFWAASLKQSRGPWQAVTVVEAM